MLSFSFYFVLLLTFFVLLTTALGLTLKTLTTLFQVQLKNQWWITATVTAFIIVLFVYARGSNESLYRLILNYMGLVNFSFFVALLYWIPVWIVRLVRGEWLRVSTAIAKSVGFAYIAMVISIVVVAIYNFHKPESIVAIEIESEKITRPYHFIHISDLQYGTTSKAEMVAKLERVYGLEPDFIVFTGDLIDFEGYATEDFEVLKRSPVPIFFERGNHEFYHDPTRLLSDLNQIDTLQLLINKKASFSELDIVGVDFGDGKGHLQRQLARIPLSAGRFSILLYHEPIDIRIGVAHGFDLLLFGHTHGGQIWPYTWLIDVLYEFGDGLFSVDGSTVYTSDGLSLWGPRMRLGSQNEIVSINLLPTAATAR